MTRMTRRLAGFAAKLHHWTTVAVATAATVGILRRYQAGDSHGIAAVAAIVGTATALSVASLARDAADALRSLAAATAAGVEALGEIERSVAEIEHTVGLAEESFDLLAAAGLTLTGPADIPVPVSGGDPAVAPAPAPAPAPARHP
jgi:hypothetical protein